MPAFMDLITRPRSENENERASRRLQRRGVAQIRQGAERTKQRIAERRDQTAQVRKERREKLHERKMGRADVD